MKSQVAKFVVKKILFHIFVNFDDSFENYFDRIIYRSKCIYLCIKYRWSSKFSPVLLYKAKRLHGLVGDREIVLRDPTNAAGKRSNGIVYIDLIDTKSNNRHIDRIVYKKPS